MSNTHYTDITEIWKHHFTNNGCLTVTLFRPDIKKAIEDSMLDYARRLTETGAADEGKFSEWCSLNGWWFHENRNAWIHSTDSIRKRPKTTSELIQIFKAETQKR